MPDLHPSPSASTPNLKPGARLQPGTSDTASRSHLSRVFSAQHLDEVSHYHGGDHDLMYQDHDNETEYSDELEQVESVDYDEAARKGQDEVPGLRMDVLDTRDLEANLEKKPTSRSIKDPNLVSWDGPKDPENPKN